MGLGLSRLGLGLKGRGVPLWIPTTETGCVEWYKTTMGVTVTAGIARWLDLSGEFNHMGQDTAANKPALSGTGLVFTKATNDNLRLGTAIGVDDGYTFGAALQYTTATPAASPTTVFVEGNAANEGVAFGHRTASREQIHPGVTNLAWGALTANPETWVFRHDGVGASADFALNGAHQTPQGLGNNLAPSATTVLAARAVGTNGAPVTIWGVIAYSDRKSDAIVANMSAYLTALRNGTTLPAWRPTDETNLVLWLERPDLWAGSHVSAWANQGTAGATRDLLQANAAKRLVLIPGAGPNGGPALHADGVDDFLKGTWTQAQPTHLFMVGLATQSGVGNATNIDGAAFNSRRIFSPNGSNLAAYAGAQLTDTGGALSTQWRRIEALYNGASGKFIVDDRTPITGNIGATASDGLTIPSDTVTADSLITELFAYNRNDLSAAAQANAHAYLTKEYGV